MYPGPVLKHPGTVVFELERIVAPEVSMVAMALLSLPQLNYIPAMEGGVS